MKLLPVCLAASLALAAAANAQDAAESPTPRNSRIAIWKCETPGGTYSVSVRAINAVSISEYVVDGTARVTEVNLDTTGDLLPRFYFLEPIGAQSPLGIGQATIDKAQELLEEAADRTGQGEVWSQAIKNYPTTTHAHTVEYRVDSKESLDKIYKSAESAFRLQRSETVKLK